MNFIRNHKTGEFTNKRKPLSTWQKRTLASIAIVCFSIALGGSLAKNEGWMQRKELHVVNVADAAEIVLMENHAATIDEMKADVLDRLGKCENPNGKPIVFDTNGVASVGQYQWQPHSFQHYWKKMTGQEITEKEAVILALDDTKARELAAWVIFETDAGSGKDWVNCTKWHGLDMLVKFIKAHD